MKSTFKVIFYVKKDKIKLNGLAPVFCRITIDGSATRFSLKAEIDPELWNIDFARANGKSKEAVELNRILDSTMASLHVIYRKTLERDNYVTAEKVKNSFLGLSKDTTTLLELFKKHNEDLNKTVGKSIVKATMQRYERAYLRLEEFMKSEYSISDISLREITPQFITDFDLFLRTSAGYNVNTANKFVSIFKKIVTIGKNNGWVTVDPFGSHRMKYEKVDRGYLTDTELRNIIDKDFGTDRLNQVRDIFVFSCYTGLAYIDVSLLTTSDIRESFDGNLWIMTKREKTGTNVNVPLLDVPLALIEKYKDKVVNKKLLPVISNQKMNAYLKEIATVCGIEKNLTFHLARCFKSD